MTQAGSRHIIVAGAGIGGLTAALAFASHGMGVTIFERTPHLEEVGAGLQLSPNATRILRRLGVLESLWTSAVRPQAIVLRDASTLREVGRVPLGEAAQTRWGAPYLTIHRADLQSALLAQVAATAEISLVTGAAVRNATVSGHEIAATIESADRKHETTGTLLVGADGVWSRVRSFGGKDRPSRFTGHVAWRRTIAAQSPDGLKLATIAHDNEVTAFLHPRFHMVVYPLRGGKDFNLAAFTRGAGLPQSWDGKADPAILSQAMAGAEPRLAAVADGGPWTAWPIDTVDARAPWTQERIALIGDAAHAMTPFAAQGAAMAIEDADTLASSVSAAKGDGLADALAGWERERKPRAARVARRGALNQMAWHARGPVALARDMIIRTKGPDRLAADLDWLYG